MDTTSLLLPVLALVLLALRNSGRHVTIARRFVQSLASVSARTRSRTGNSSNPSSSSTSGACLLCSHAIVLAFKPLRSSASRTIAGAVSFVTAFSAICTTIGVASSSRPSVSFAVADSDEQMWSASWLSAIDLPVPAAPTTHSTGWRWPPLPSHEAIMPSRSCCVPPSSEYDAESGTIHGDSAFFARATW